MANSDYKLKDLDEFNVLCRTNKEFVQWASPVYDYLEIMKPGSIIKLKTADPKYLPWLIITACAFFLSDNHWKEYEFNNDFTKFRRN